MSKKMAAEMLGKQQTKCMMLQVDCRPGDAVNR